MQPLISIITVTYNAEKTLPATIDSVDRQSMTDFEHLIIDGASKDSTADIARRACADRRMVFSEPDKGLYDAMNKGISKARGQYLIFLNAGDSFHTSDTLQIIADTIRNNSYPGIVYGQTQLVDADRRRIADRHLTAPENLSQLASRPDVRSTVPLLGRLRLVHKMPATFAQKHLHTADHHRLSERGAYHRQPPGLADRTFPHYVLLLRNHTHNHTAHRLHSTLSVEPEQTPARDTTMYDKRQQ